LTANSNPRALKPPIRQAGCVPAEAGTFKGKRVSVEVLMPRDPVCNMEVSEETAVATSQFEDRKFYFCSQSCKEQFEDDPELYLETAA